MMKRCIVLIMVFLPLFGWAQTEVQTNINAKMVSVPFSGRLKKVKQITELNRDVKPDSSGVFELKNKYVYTYYKNGLCSQFSDILKNETLFHARIYKLNKDSLIGEVVSKDKWTTEVLGRYYYRKKSTLPFAFIGKDDSICYRYDTVGRLTAITDYRLRRGQGFVYDSLGRIVQENVYEYELMDEHFEYNNILASLVYEYQSDTAGVRVDVRYFSLGALVVEATPVAPTKEELDRRKLGVLTNTYFFDLNGLLIREVQYDKNKPCSESRFEYQFYH